MNTIRLILNVAQVHRCNNNNLGALRICIIIRQQQHNCTPSWAGATRTTKKNTVEWRRTAISSAPRFFFVFPVLHSLHYPFTFRTATRVETETLGVPSHRRDVYNYVNALLLRIGLQLMILRSSSLNCDAQNNRGVDKNSTGYWKFITYSLDDWQFAVPKQISNPIRCKNSVVVFAASEPPCAGPARFVFG